MSGFKTSAELIELYRQIDEEIESKQKDGNIDLGGKNDKPRKNTV